MTPATIAAAVMARTTWAIAPGVPISSRSRGTPIATTMRDTHHGRPVGMGCGRRMNGRPIPLVKRIRLRLLARVDKANACSLNLHRIVVGIEPTVAASSHLAELLAAIDRFRQRPKTNRQPQELAAELSRATEARTLKMSTYEDGSLALEGWIDSVGGAVVRSALEPLAQPHGDHDERGREHRNADAFVEVCSHVQDIGVLPHGLICRSQPRSIPSAPWPDRPPATWSTRCPCRRRQFSVSRAMAPSPALCWLL